MNKFFEKALKKWEKLGLEQIKELFEEAYRENNLYQSVLASLSQGILVLDPQHRILFINKSAQRSLPFTTGEKVGKDLFHSLMDDELKDYFDHHLSSKISHPGKDFSFDRGSSVLVLSISIFPLVQKGSIMGSIIGVENVTEKRRKEARLRRAETLASLTTLTAGVAHEIKNPLGSIGIHVQLMERALKQGDQKSMDKLKHFLHVIDEEVQRLNGIVVDFLFAVRPMDTQLEPGSLSKILKELVDFLQYELSTQRIKVNLDLPPTPDEINLDPRFIKQAFLNVIKNSMAAMPDGGTLDLKVQGFQDHVEVKISDTGFGIPEENLEKIFEPYFTTKDFGSGLGLTLVFKIVKEHSGDIRVLSKPDQGTSFIFFFPVPQKETYLLDYEGEQGGSDNTHR